MKGRAETELQVRVRVTPSQALLPPDDDFAADEEWSLFLEDDEAGAAGVRPAAVARHRRAAKDITRGNGEAETNWFAPLPDPPCCISPLPPRLRPSVFVSSSPPLPRRRNYGSLFPCRSISASIPAPRVSARSSSSSTGAVRGWCSRSVGVRRDLPGIRYQPRRAARRRPGGRGVVAADVGGGARRDDGAGRGAIDVGRIAAIPGRRSSTAASI